MLIDQFLKAKAKSLSDSEIDVYVDRLASIVRYLGEKDAFERYYKQHLSRRLLSSHGDVSDGPERGFLGRFKAEFGSQFSSRMEAMFSDIKLSSELMCAFRESHKDARTFNLLATVLASFCWPSMDIAPCDTPPIFNAQMKAFDEFYRDRFRGRRLTWVFSCGAAEMKLNLRKSSHLLCVSTFQMLILLCFDDPELTWLSYEHILNATHVPELHLKRNLQSLACGKFRILLKEPRSKDILDTDRFSVNLDFSSKLYRLKIPQIVNRVETETEHRVTCQRIAEDRRHVFV